MEEEQRVQEGIRGELRGSETMDGLQRSSQGACAEFERGEEANEGTGREASHGQSSKNET